MAQVRITLMLATALAACGGSQKTDSRCGEGAECDETETDTGEMTTDSVDSLESRGKLVRAAELALVRTSGEPAPTLSDELAAELRAADIGRPSAVYKVCIDEQGQTSQVTLLKSSGSEAYDSEVARVIATWSHEPFVFDGGAMAVCSPVAMAVTVEPSTDETSPADAGPPADR